LPPYGSAWEQGFTALPQRRVGWLVGVAGKAQRPWLLIIKVVGVSSLLQGTWLAGINEERGRKLPTFPCCTSRGRRKKNSVAQNDTVLLFFFLTWNVIVLYKTRCFI
jgi:hypothetical protein